MAMVSSRMASGAPLRDVAEQVGVQALGRAAPRPGGAGTDLVEGEGGHRGRVPLTAHYPLMQPAQPVPIRAGHAVEGETGQLVVLVAGIPPHIPDVLAHEAR